MKVIGLAGPAGSGKSAVARALSQRAGVGWIDLDRLAWSTYEPGTPAFTALVVRFGVGILAPDGQIDRTELARRAFADPEAKRDLDRIVHPAVDGALARRIENEREAGREVLLVEGALIGASPHIDLGLFDVMVWLEAPRRVREKRLGSVGRGEHAARNADLAAPRGAVCIDAEGPIDEVAERVWRAVRAGGEPTSARPPQP